MKKILLILFITCFSAQFLLAQEQTRLSVTPLDSNVNCAKATVIPHTLNNNEFLVDSFANKNIDNGGFLVGYYKFVAKAKSGKIKVFTDDYIWINVYEDCSLPYPNKLYTKGYNTLVTGTIENLVIGKNYIVELSASSSNSKTKIKLASIANKKDDNVVSTPTTISGIPYNFNLADYSKGRESYAGSICSTTKADSNVVTVFVKFKATSTSSTLDLNLNNASLASTLSLTSDPYTCQPIQSNKNLRTDTFTGLTVGNEYTVRIEIGGDAALGYARTETVNNASITLVGGTTTGIENDLLSSMNIYPNPTSGVINFSGTAQVFDLLGNKVAEGKETINLENVEKGIYVIKIGEKVGKIVKQ